MVVVPNITCTVHTSNGTRCPGRSVEGLIDVLGYIFSVVEFFVYSDFERGQLTNPRVSHRR